MSGNEATEAVRRSVTALGSRVGLSSREFNVGLKLAGLLEGEPGAWRLTEKGARFAAEHSHDNGYGGYAHRAWETRSWLETVVEELDLSETGIGQIRQVVADQRLAQKVAREAGTAAAEAAFRSAEAAKRTADAAQAVGTVTRTPVIVGLVAATAYGLYKAVPLIQRRRHQRADAAPDRDRSDRDEPPVT